MLWKHWYVWQHVILCWNTAEDVLLVYGLQLRVVINVCAIWRYENSDDVMILCSASSTSIIVMYHYLNSSGP